MHITPFGCVKVGTTWYVLVYPSSHKEWSFCSQKGPIEYFQYIPLRHEKPIQYIPTDFNRFQNNHCWFCDFSRFSIIVQDFPSFSSDFS